MGNDEECMVPKFETKGRLIRVALSYFKQLFVIDNINNPYSYEYCATYLSLIKLEYTPTKRRNHIELLE
jgi:hypothetical protein